MGKGDFDEDPEVTFLAVNRQGLVWHVFGGGDEGMDEKEADENPD